MKAQILSQTGKKEIEMPEFFSTNIREDIAQKFFEAEKEIQPYGPNPEAGKHHSASGRMAHSRRKWKTSYGKGMSRVPRKTMWRRGDHFYWVGAETSGTRGGRQSHPPKPIHFQAERKINRKEQDIAIKSAFAATANPEIIKKRYATLREEKITILPIVIDGNILKLKTQDFLQFLEKNLGKSFEVAIKRKTQRAGKGKMRNRRYRENAGMLLVTGKGEQCRISGIDVRKISELEIEDLWPLGRLTAYSEQAVRELKEVKEMKK
jgi:large subunit ribosomal protein L4e